MLTKLLTTACFADYALIFFYSPLLQI